MPLSLANAIQLASVSADPSTLADGDLWLRSDDGVLRYRTNGQTIPNIPATPTPFWGVSTWQRLQNGAQGTQATTLNTMYAVPFMPPRIYTLTDIAIAVTTAATSGVARLGLYSSLSTGFPGNLIQEIGTVSTAATSTGLVKTLSPSVVLYPGNLYYLSLVSQTAAATYRTRAIDDPLILSSAAAPNLTGSNSSIINSSSTTSGVLPLSWGTPSSTSPGPGPEFVIRGT